MGESALTESMADKMSSFCKCAERLMSASSCRERGGLLQPLHGPGVDEGGGGVGGVTLLVFTAGSLAMTPVPEQGASSSTLSKPPITCSRQRQIKKTQNGAVCSVWILETLPSGTASRRSCRQQCWSPPACGCCPPRSSVCLR